MTSVRRIYICVFEIVYLVNTVPMEECRVLNGFDAHQCRNAVIRDEKGRFMKSAPHDDDGSIILGIPGDEADDECFRVVP